MPKISEILSEKQLRSLKWEQSIQYMFAAAEKQEAILNAALDEWQKEMEKIDCCFNPIACNHTTVKRAIRLKKSYLDSFYREGVTPIGAKEMKRRISA